MTCYRVRHKETGLYFCPCREVICKVETGKHADWKVRSNLSKRGKVYTKYPSFTWFERIHSHVKIEGAKFSSRWNELYEPIVTQRDDWEVEIL